MASELVPVVNISMVGPANDIVGSVTQNLIRQGYTIVAPVGNDGSAALPLYPASYPGVIAVSAAADNGRLLPEASRVHRVDFVAPGVATVLDTSGRATIVRGTSFAAPIVSRLFADQITVPDHGSAHRALMQLVRSAIRPRSDGQWYGHGLVGRAPPSN
jgi:subtilisin family serine protease